MVEPFELTPLRATDVALLAKLHQEAFPGFFLSTLGTPFLEQFYRGFLSDPTAVTVVARRDAEVLGAVVGTTEPNGFFARLLRRQILGFVVASARAVASNPRSLRRVLRGVRYRGDAPVGSEGALLSSICVDPKLHRAGVGSALLAEWSQLAGAAGAQRAHLTTDATDNDAVNGFYQRHGWAIEQTYETPDGRLMNRYMTVLGGTRC